MTRQVGEKRTQKKSNKNKQKTDIRTIKLKNDQKKDNTKDQEEISVCSLTAYKAPVTDAVCSLTNMLRTIDFQ